MHSWCKGAMALAEAGLLDGRTATAHWGDLPKLERSYPAVRWIRGVRWIDHGSVVMSAGITSGVDASLHVIQRLTGDQVARRVARELRYSDLRFMNDPAAPQLFPSTPDAILLANAAYGGLVRQEVGLALYPGVGELDFSNLYDSHVYTMTADVEAIGEREIVETAHGLTLLPSIVLARAGDADRVGALERLVVPGVDARGPNAASLLASLRRRISLRAEYLHADEPHRFGLELALEDLAGTSDVATARFALRRMEYRRELELVGAPLRLGVIVPPILLFAAGLMLVRIAARRGGGYRPGPARDQ